MFSHFKEKIQGYPNHIEWCPGFWSQQNYDDRDEGCHLQGNFFCANTFDCEKCKYKFLPNFILKIIIKYREWKFNKYLEKEIENL